MFAYCSRAGAWVVTVTRMNEGRSRIQRQLSQRKVYTNKQYAKNFLNYTFWSNIIHFLITKIIQK